jgi:hypothetical protein
MMSTDKNEWQERYERQVIPDALRRAAVAAGAYHPSQVVNELMPYSEPAPDVAPCPVRVNYPSVSTETGKPMLLAFDAAGAVAYLKTLPEHANLFRANLPGDMSREPKAIHEMSTEEYQARRRKARPARGNT